MNSSPNIPEKPKKKKPRKTLLDAFMEGPGVDTFRRGAEAVRKLDEPIETGSHRLTSDGVTSDGVTKVRRCDVTPSDPKISLKLSALQKKVLGYLDQIRNPDDPDKTIVISYSEIARALRVKPRGVRSAINGLGKKAVISSIVYKSISKQGLIHRFLQKRSDGLTLVRPSDVRPSSSILYLNNTTTTCVGSDGLTHVRPSDPFSDFIEALDISDWPKLKPEKLSPFVEMGGEEIQFILDAAKAIIDEKKDTDKPIDNNHSFLFSCLKKGWVDPPKGFKSREEKIAEKKILYFEKKKKRLEALKEKRLKAASELVWEQMSSEEKAGFEKEIIKKAQNRASSIKPPQPYIDGLRTQALTKKAEDMGLI
jgi:predicted transcriptional regulator with HTH domain